MINRIEKVTKRSAHGKFSRVLCSSLIFFLGAVLPVFAQTGAAKPMYSSKGIQIFPSITLSNWSADVLGIDGESGTGGGIGFGYGFSNRVALIVNLIGGTMKQTGTGDQYSLGHIDVGVRGAFGPLTSRWRFIAEILVSGIASENAFPKPKKEVEGRMYSLGAGAQYFVYRSVAIQFHVTAGSGTLNQYKIENEEVEPGTYDTDFETRRVGLSLIWYAMN